MKTKATMRRAALSGKPRGTAKPKSRPKAPAPKRPARWAWHRRTLLALRDRLRAEALELRAANAGPLNPEVADFADAAENRRGREIIDAELRTEESLLEEVEAALRRLSLGTYGICEGSGRPILPSRLRAIPWARLNRPANPGKRSSVRTPKRQPTP
jgi:RNA polymerase-binding transcription factor DksA